MESKAYNAKEVIKTFQQNIQKMEVHVDTPKMSSIVVNQNYPKCKESKPDVTEKKSETKLGHHGLCVKVDILREMKTVEGESSEEISTVSNSYVMVVSNRDQTLQKGVSSSENCSKTQYIVENEYNKLHQSKESNQKRKTMTCTIERKWFILLAGFVLIFMSAGFPFQLSIMYVELLDEFETSYAETSLVQAVCTGTFFGGGFISGLIVARYGVQVVGSVGGIISATGLSISFVAMNIPYLVVTVGGIAGFGFSLAYVCSSTCVGHHFEGKRKLLALSFITFGSGVGSMAIPYIMEYLIQMYDWRGTLLIFGGICLNFIPAALICVPADKPNANKNIKGDRSSPPNLPQDERNSEAYTNEDNKNKEYARNGMIRGLKHVLKNKLFLVYAIGMTLALSSLNSLLILFVDFYQSSGMTRSQAVFVFFIFNTINAFSRFVPGFLKQVPHFSVLAIPTIHASIGCITAAMFPLAETYGQLLLVSCFHGIAMGGVVTALSVTTMRLIGVENYATGLGVLLSTCSMGVLSAGPISGKLRDISGSYDLSFYTVSGALGCASVIFVTTMILRKKTKMDEMDENMEMIVIDVNRRISRKRSSILPWKQTLDFVH